MPHYNSMRQQDLSTKEWDGDEIDPKRQLPGMDSINL
jgi:hypothetical protein